MRKEKVLELRRMD